MGDNKIEISKKDEFVYKLKMGNDMWHFLTKFLEGSGFLVVRGEDEHE